MKRAEFLQNSIEHINEKYVIEAKRKKASSILRYGLLAACVALVISSTALAFLFKTPPANTETSLPPVDYTPIIFNPVSSPETVSGSPLVFVKEPSYYDGISAAPPAMEFGFTGIIVKAEIVNVLPDVYYELNSYSYSKPMAYKLIQFHTLDVISGKNVPEYFYYRIYESLEVDFSPYDFFILSMSQLGTENYVLRNGSKNTIDTFPLTVFYTGGEIYGNILAFTDGVFDEALWQNENWFFGYQFLRDYLDAPDNYSSYIAVKRGCDEQYTRDKINEEIDKWREHRGDNYTEPQVRSLEFSTPQAKAVLEYVKPFENGVFAQRFNYPFVTYERFINGCYTGEYVSIDLTTEEISCSETKYDSSDLTAIENISLQISALAEQYRNEQPSPPHITDTEGKKLNSLFLYGWYVKTDNGMYGVVKTAWEYIGEVEVYELKCLASYYDESYILYDMSNSTARAVTREELISVIGENRHIYNGEFGAEEILPFE